MLVGIAHNTDRYDGVVADIWSKAPQLVPESVLSTESDHLGLCCARCQPLVDERPEEQFFVLTFDQQKMRRFDPDGVRPGVRVNGLQG